MASHYELVKSGDASFDALPEREQLIASHAHKLVQDFGGDENLQKALDWTVDSLDEIYGFNKPEDLSAFAAKEVQYAWHRLHYSYTEGDCVYLGIDEADALEQLDRLEAQYDLLTNCE